jgi:hypothetical protein
MTALMRHGRTSLSCLALVTACSSAPGVGSIEENLCTCDAEIPPCCCWSPILIDVAGNGFQLTSWADGVEFAPHPGFRPSDRAWTEANSDDAWLVWDRDDDGAINDGSEMFGSATPQPHPPEGALRNGFLALAQYDDDHNDTIDATDAIFSKLRLWQDRDHDGKSQPMELHALPELGVAGIALIYAEDPEVDEYGNSFRYKAAVYGTPGSPVGMIAWDVWLVGAEPEPVVGGDAAALGSPVPMPNGNPDELQRCYTAADGDQNTWLDYCNTVPVNIRRSCREIASDNKQTKRNWCYNYWGEIFTCTNQDLGGAQAASPTRQ